jgi:hypothetical protein
MLAARQDSADGRNVARQLVGDHYPRLVLTVAQNASWEAFSGVLVPSLLDQDVEPDSILVVGPPQPVTLASDLQYHLVEVPVVPRARLAAPQPG